MEIRKQILGIVIGIFITISFITPVYSYYNSYTNVCDMNAGDLESMMRNMRVIFFIIKSFLN